MKRFATVVLVSVFALSMMVLADVAQARERKSSGSYQGRSTSGTFQRDVNKSRGSMSKKTTWQNQRGEGSSQRERGWDKGTATGSYSSRLETAGDKTVTRAGTVAKNEDGSFSQNGTITGPKSKTTTVDRDYAKNEDGSRSVDTVYTSEGGKTLTVDKDIVYEDGARNVTGSYETNTGKSGTFNGTTSFEDGRMTSDRSLTNQNGETWSQKAIVDRDGNTINRNVTNTKPSGESQTFNQSVTINEVIVEP